MNTKFSINGKAVPEERIFIKDNDEIIKDMICDTIKAALQPFYQLNDIYSERLGGIESKMYAFDQAMGKELRALQTAVRMLPNMTQYSLGDACGRIDRIHEKLDKMMDNISSILQGSKSRDTDGLERLRTLENLIMQMPGLKEAIETKELKIKSEIETKALAEKKAALDILIGDLELSTRSRNALRNDNIKCIRDLIEKTRAEMLRIPNFGRESLREIEELLASMNLKFDMQIDTIATELPIEPIKHYIELLDPRSREIMRQRYFSGVYVPYVNIGVSFNISGQRVRQIIICVFKKLRKYYGRYIDEGKLDKKDILAFLGNSKALYEDIFGH